VSEGCVRNELTLGHQLHDDSLRQPLQSWYFQQRRVSSSDAFCMTCDKLSSTNAFMFLYIQWISLVFLSPRFDRESVYWSGMLYCSGRALSQRPARIQ
jgi:hypothetical protein